MSINFYGKMIEKFLGIQEKIICTLEGGYNADALKKGVANEIGVMNDTPVNFDDYPDEKGDVEEIIKSLKSTFQNYWNL